MLDWRHPDANFFAAGMHFTDNIFCSQSIQQLGTPVVHNGGIATKLFKNKYLQNSGQIVTRAVAITECCFACGVSM
ncbi:MAG TPA: hypothetical protein VK663_15335, partial [Burkholderiales bacterium]|nr:hypothetical protein [Burkholderiales bacterium]